MEFGVSPGIEVDAMQFYVELLAEGNTKSLISVRLFSSQMEITMTCLYGITQFMKYQQQSNTVCSSRKGNQIFFVFFQKMLLDDVLLYGLYELHVVILF